MIGSNTISQANNQHALIGSEEKDFVISGPGSLSIAGRYVGIRPFKSNLTISVDEYNLSVAGLRVNAANANEKFGVRS